MSIRAAGRPQCRPGHQCGFTLIELLVVIVILGILSAVVVFAVKGAGDKGEANARAADKRTVRTALEAFCATYGRYAENMDELVNGPPEIPGAKGFLSDKSTYNHTIVSVPPGQNNCGGTGYAVGGEPDECTRLVGDEVRQVTPTPTMVADGFWCFAAPPPGIPAGQEDQHPLVQLPNGKVLLVLKDRHDLDSQDILGTPTKTGHPTALFDPTDPSGTWTAGPVAYYTPGNGEINSDPFDGMVLLEDSPTTEGNDCAPNCGKVLAHFAARDDTTGSHHWTLYNPAAGQAGEWTEIEPRSTVARPKGAKAVQLLGPGCDPHCGKVLIVPREACGNVPHVAEFYDPKRNEFTIAGLYVYSRQAADGGKCAIFPQMAEVSNGKVLLVTTVATNPLIQTAMLLNPSDVPLPFFEQIAENPITALGPHRYRGDAQPTILPNGGVFLTHRVTEIFHVDPPNTGTWESTAHCGGATPGDAFCHVLSVLPDSRVLVHVNSGFRRCGCDPTVEETTMRLFDSTKSDGDRWSDTGSLNHFHSAGYAVLLSGSGCGSNCNKVLIVGATGQKAELYTSPS